MLEKLTNLIDVKSIVTLVLTLVFAYLAIIGTIDKDNYMMVFIMIMTYFFTKKNSTTNEVSTTKADEEADDII